MDKKIIKELKNKLKQDKKRLTKDLRSFAKKDPKIKGNWMTRFPFLGASRSLDDSNAEEVESYAALLPVEHALELRLKDVNLALDKIEKGDSGDYGKCEKCGKEINVERLKINPEARACMDCVE
ncbi:TraR/DksA family transcriptional regulator [Patescibacteria group bacterium]